jgi:hypothetical protein
MKQNLIAMLAVAGALFATQAQLINFDLMSSAGTDAYATGAAVFGAASSQWNERSRLLSASSVSLFDDAGTATSVKVNYVRAGSGGSSSTGAFAALGISTIGTGTVTLDGLAAGGAYQLAVFSGWNGIPSFTVGSQTKTIAPNNNWSSLNPGVQYVLFQALADASGVLSFTPNVNPTGSFGYKAWSAFQLQDVPAPAPEPTYGVLMGVGLAAWAASRCKAGSAV